MQGSYYFLDLDTRAMIKRRRFTELPMPDSVIKRVERWGKRDKQNGTLSFCDRNNIPFEWSDDQEPQDNAPEPEPAVYPDVLTETPGVVLKSNVPALSAPPLMTEEQRMAALLENAGIAGEFKEFQYRGNGRAREQHHGGDVHMTHNHINIVPPEQGEIVPMEEGEEDMEEDEAVPDLQDEDDSSDDETYVDEEIEDIELVYDEVDETNEDGDENHLRAQTELFQETRSGRRVKPPERF